MLFWEILADEKRKTKINVGKKDIFIYNNLKRIGFQLRSNEHPNYLATKINHF